jgi:hypothetical protein
MRSLNLVVVYFDALLVLSRFVKNQNSNSVDVNINVKVLLLPCPSKDTRMLPWKMLLQHETYFPGKPSPSAKEIIDFLKPVEPSKNTDAQMKKSQKPSKKSHKSSKKYDMPTEVSPESITGGLASLQRDMNDPDIDIFIEKITEAIDSLMTSHYGDATPGSMQYIDKIVKRLTSINNRLVIYRATLDMYEEINDIIGLLRPLADNVRLERILRSGSSLDAGVGFKGTFHAEACIASHCTFTEPKWFPPVSHFIMFCSDLSDVVYRLHLYEQQVYLNSAVQSVDLCSGTLTPHSSSQRRTTPSNHVHCLPLFHWRLSKLRMHSLGVC